MENKGLLILASVILITLLLVVSVSAKVNNDLKDSLKSCTNECKLDEKIAHQSCISVHKNDSTQIREEYKKCTKDLKDIFKNNTSNSKINKKELNNKLKECNKKYLAGLKEADKIRKECLKNSQINCEKKCKQEFCIQVYKPVCGVDNKTYSNECELKKANVTKAYDGECNNAVENLSKNSGDNIVNNTLKENNSGDNGCIKEGGSGDITRRDVCCDGLNKMGFSVPSPDGKRCSLYGTQFTCSKTCGNKICDSNSGENRCNCPRDC